MGKLSEFVHLHTHSNYSLREGAAYVSHLAGAAAEMGMEALALTDHDGMYGAVRFSLACRGAGIRPILGAELEWGDGYHVTLLAQNSKGWANLCRLVTDMHVSDPAPMDTWSLGSRAGSGKGWITPAAPGPGSRTMRREKAAQANHPDETPRRPGPGGGRTSAPRSPLVPGKRPRTSFEAIAAHSEGLFALSGCSRGEVPWFASLGQMDLASSALKRWVDVFEGRFAIEVQNHLLEDDPVRIRRLESLAKSFGLRTVATNNVHYVQPEDALLHDVLDCIRRIVPLSKRTAPRQNAEYWLKPPAQMAALHSREAIEGACWVASRCTYQLPLGEFHFPDPGAESGRSSTELLAKRCWDGLNRRYSKVSPQIEERLQRELRMIRRGGFCGYFLLVDDIVDHCKRKLGIRCACRGSAAGSLVAYALGISDVDPIRHDLVFERFMNEYRREIPDIDIDFESARREEVNDYILSTYGERTAMVAMMETFQARAALREVGKALGIAETEIDVIAKAFPHIAARNIPKAIESLPEVAGLNLRASQLETLFDLAGRLDCFPRHLAMHPSGVILSDETLGDIMPMQRSFQGFLMSQFDKDDVEALGIAKLDVLGVRMFSTITHTLEEIERTRGFRPDIGLTQTPAEPPEQARPPRSIASDDPATLALIRESRTLGCFQIESPGQRELLGKFQPDRFEDLIIDISLFRPGPMKADMVKPFLNRRMGFEPVGYGDPSLAPILKETNGVIVYHEQVMRVISALTGCSLGEADKLRRSLDDLFEKSANSAGASGGGLKDQIIERSVNRGWDRRVAEKIWNEVLAFASFGFCKAHAAAFAVPTYQSAWLKAHYPAEFYCGVLTHDPGMYPRRAILSDARAHGIPILPVDINASWPEYRAEPVVTAVEMGPVETWPSEAGWSPAGLDGPVETYETASNQVFGIRIGLQDVKGISEAEIDEIVSGRPWRSLSQFCRKARVTRPVVESLVHVGAFDSIKGKKTRRELLWSSAAEASRPAGGQMELAADGAEQIQLPGISDYSLREQVNAELEVTGMEASRHLISFYTQRLEQLGWTPACELLSKRGGAPVVVAGVKVATQTPPVRSGKRVIFLTLDDGTGQPNIAFFDEAQSKYARVVFDGWILAVKGTLRRTGVRGISILAEEVIDLGKPKDVVPRVWHTSPGSAG